jgi:hypothetical protein
MIDLNDVHPRPAELADTNGMPEQVAIGYICAERKANGGKRFEGTWARRRVRRLDRQRVTQQSKETTTCSRRFSRAPSSAAGRGEPWRSRASLLRRSRIRRLGATRARAFARRLRCPTTRSSSGRHRHRRRQRRPGLQCSSDDRPWLDLQRAVTGPKRPLRSASTSSTPTATPSCWSCRSTGTTVFRCGWTQHELPQRCHRESDEPRDRLAYS